MLIRENREIYVPRKFVCIRYIKTVAVHIYICLYGEISPALWLLYVAFIVARCVTITRLIASKRYALVLAGT